VSESFVNRRDQLLLDAITVNAWLIDAKGNLVAVNRAWSDSQLPSDLAALRVPVGTPMIEALHASAGLPASLTVAAVAVADAIVEILAGRISEYEYEVPVGDDAWWMVRIAALPDDGGAVMTLRDITARVRAERRIDRRDGRDQLTGLATQPLLVERLAVALGQPDGRRVAVLQLDLDRFSLLNATYGWAEGNRVLRTIARRLRTSLTNGESLARTGADTFVVLTERAHNDDEVVSLAEWLGRAVALPMLIDGREVMVTASVGVAIAGTDPTSPEDLLRDADVAMLKAKALGGAGHVVSSQLLRTDSAKRVAIQRALTGALARGEMWLEFQPEVAIDDRTVVGAEALLRWHSEELGSVPPSVFIEVAEETGLIVAIGNWAMGEAIRQAAGWQLPRPDTNDFYVAVNVAPRQLADPDFAANVEEALRVSGLPPRRLCIEVTERTVVGAWDAASSALQRLADIGVRIALDDFGTGYSSLAYLVRLPIQILKLDASFVTRLASDEADVAVVEAVVTLARRLGLQVVAEGVEDEAQRAELERLGCHIVQGYETGHPGDASALLRMIWSRAERSTA
jgi:diguanylate cyclase (GGDEF)-like protein